MTTFIEHGRQKPEYVLQPDYSFSHNGYGLLQLTATFAVDTAKAGKSGTTFYRGAGFPATTDQLGKALAASATWTCVKAEERGREGNMSYVTAHYAAIDPEVGEFTQTEASMTSAVVSEPIESHPNFTKVQAVGIGDGSTPLGGTWVNGVPPSVDNEDVNKFRALWQKTVNVQVGAESYNFVGFAPADSTKKPNRKAGVKSWMRPTINLKMTSYTSNAINAAIACSYSGMIVKNKVNFLAIPEAYKGIGQNGMLGLSEENETAGRDWLVTGANMEVFGGLYKVQVDLLLSGVLGWDKDIYCDTQE